MPNLEVTVMATLDGVPVDGFPVVKRLAITTKDAREFQQATGVSFVALTDDVASVSALLLQSDQAIAVKLNGGATSAFTLNAGGLALLLDVLINSGPTTNVTVQNNSGSTATIRGRVFGA